MEGLGNGPAATNFNPRNFRKDAFKNGDSLEAIIKTINTGVPNTVMVGWKGILKEDEIKSIASYVIYLKNK